MARIDLKNKAIQAKLVYYGPGLCGKTTNLQYINAHMAGGQELMSLATEGDRTIFFDFMPLGLGKLRGLDVQFKLYTVPGQVRYNQTRKMVLKNVDGVVFVADSQTEMIDANLESLDNLYENLGELGIDPDDVPIVLQYNKRDLPNVMSADELDAALNSRKFSTFMASAYTGDGVVDTLKAACKEVLGYLSKALPGREEEPAADKTASPSPSKAAARNRGNGAPSPAVAASTGNAGEAPAGGADATPAEAKPDGGSGVGEEPTAPGHEAIAELSRSLAAARQELAELRGPAQLDEDTYDKLADRLVSKTDMVVLHRRVDGVEEIARNNGALVTGLLERLGAVAGQLDELGRTLARRPEQQPSAKVELPARLEQLPTKSDLAGLAKKLEPIAQLPTKSDLAGLARKLEPIAQLPTKSDLAGLAKKLEALGQLPAESDLAGLTRKIEPIAQLPTKSDLAGLAKKIGQLPTKSDLADLAGKVERLEPGSGGSKSGSSGAAQAAAAPDLAAKQDVEVLAKKLGGVAEQLSAWTASRADLVASKQALEAAARREDLAELRAAMVKLGARIESGQTAPASPQPSTELRELAARLERLPTKAELAALDKRVASLPTRGDLERLEKSLTQALAQVRAIAADQEARPAPAAGSESQRPPATAVGEATANGAETEPQAAAEAAAETEGPGAAVDAAAPQDDAAETAAADPPAAETESAEDRESAEAAKGPDAEAAAETATDEAAAETAAAEAAEEPAADEAAAETATDEAAAETATGEAAEEPAADEAAAETATDEAAAGEQPAGEAKEPPGEPAAAAAGSTAEVDDDSPEHKNAARVARVMVADLYLYNKDEVEAGIREDDFFERNHEALEDMRLTFESRVPEEVRAQKDHLRLAIEAFIQKKRAKLASP